MAISHWSQCQQRSSSWCPFLTAQMKSGNQRRSWQGIERSNYVEWLLCSIICRAKMKDFTVNAIGSDQCTNRNTSRWKNHHSNWRQQLTRDKTKVTSLQKSLCCHGINLRIILGSRTKQTTDRTWCSTGMYPCQLLTQVREQRAVFHRMSIGTHVFLGISISKISIMLS